jgi:O-antigen/teichoic acid export membrane protein
MNFRKKIFEGAVFSIVQRFIAQGLQFAVAVVLARLLSPSDFGVAGMLTLFVTLGAVLETAGFPSALIQRKGGTDEEKTAVFYFSVIVAALYSILFFNCAPLMARFFNEPLLTLIARAYSVQFVFSAVSSVYETVLRAALEFKKIMICRVVSAFFSGCLGVTLALKGLGVWSLVWMSIADTMLSTTGLFLSSSWRPKRCIDLRPLKSLFGFGSKAFLTTILDQCADKMNTVIIGRFYTPALLGFYTRATRLQGIVADNFLFSLLPVMFSGFSHIQGESERLRQSCIRALRLLSALNMPLFVGMAILARPLIILVYGEQWAPAVIYFQILCLGAIFIPVALVNRTVLMAMGMSGMVLKITVVTRICSVLFLLLVARQGVLTLAVVFALNSWIFSILQAWGGKRAVRLSILQQCIVLAPIVTSTVFMVGVFYFLGIFIDNDLIRSICFIPVGGAAYLFSLRILCPDAYREFVVMLGAGVKKVVGRDRS